MTGYFPRLLEPRRSLLKSSWNRRITPRSSFSERLSLWRSTEILRYYRRMISYAADI